MIKNIESQKEKMKARLLQEVDGYYEKFERSSNEAGFDINKIEELMIEQDSKIKKVMECANSELTSSVDVLVKKNAQSANISLKKPKQEKS